MSEVERVAHSIRHGNKYHLKASNAGLLDQAAAYNEDRKDPYAGTNIATVVRQQGDELAAGSQEDRDYLRGAYLKKFQAQYGNSGSFAEDDNVDWRNFIAQGFELSPEEMLAIQSTTGTNNDFTFGGSGWTPDASAPSVGHGGTFRPPSGPSGGGNAGGGASAAPDFGPAVEMTNRAGNTPFIDAYMRSRESAKKEGPVTGMMKKYME
jgi:hypothetical protein